MVALKSVANAVTKQTLYTLFLNNKHFVKCPLQEIECAIEHFAKFDDKLKQFKSSYRIASEANKHGPTFTRRFAWPSVGKEIEFHLLAAYLALCLKGKTMRAVIVRRESMFGIRLPPLWGQCMT